MKTKLIKLTLGLFVGLLAMDASAEYSALSSCREAYANFLKSDMRFSGSATDVVGACQVTLRDTQSRQMLSKELTECWRKNPSLSSDGDVDREASVRRNKCTAGKAHDMAVNHGKPDKHADFIENCIKSGKSRTECLEIMVGKNSPTPLYKRAFQEASAESKTGVN